MKKIFAATALISTMVLTGCASSYMTPANDAAPKADENSATVTFFRPSLMGSAFQAPIAEDAKNGNLKFVGIVSKGTKIKEKVAPGKHTYVVGGESSSLLEADFKANSNYYVRVEPHLGFVKARYSLDPVSPQELQNPKVQNEIKDCYRVEVNEQGQGWFVENKKDMQQKMYDAKQDFAKASDKDKALHTLKPEAGVSAVY